MNPAWCSYCRKASQPIEEKRKHLREPSRRTETTTFGSSAINQGDMNTAGWTVVHIRKGKQNSEYAELGYATHIHIAGLPMLWAIELILAKAPRLRKIQVIPSMYGHLRPESHLRLCMERGVEVVTGHVRPDMAWAEGDNRSPFYKGQQLFFASLQGEQKALWDELLAMNFESALMTARYFCLNSERFLSKRAIAEEYGYSFDGAAVAWRRINAVIAYLDPSFETGRDVKLAAIFIKPKVERLRKYFESADRERLLVSELAISSLPADLPFARFETFKALVTAEREGKLQSLPETRAKVLYLRFGLNSGRYLTLQKVADQMNGITRERVRQLEEEGLDLLGISHEID